ncbi:MAG: hypothetical protein MUO72_01125 [Bacteroidales bacterium]|nr:hypothetical protein [Bacteroidales bacterium]
MLSWSVCMSPDGKNLAFSSVENNEQHIYTTQVDGGSPKQMAEIQAQEPVFSPDGKMIAYVKDKDLGSFYQQFLYLMYKNNSDYYEQDPIHQPDHYCFGLLQIRNQKIIRSEKGRNLKTI